MAQAFTSSSYFKANIVKDRRELMDPLLSGSIRGFVVIPSYFTTFLKNPSKIAPIQVIADGSETNTANFVHNYVAGVWQNWNFQKITPPLPIGLMYLHSQDFDIMSSLKVETFLSRVFSHYNGFDWNFVDSFSSLKRMGKRHYGSPHVHSCAYRRSINRKASVLFSFRDGAMSLSVFIAIFLYQVPFRGSFLLLALASSIFLLACLEIGLLISTLAKNQFAASQAVIVSAFLPAFMLSGFIFEIASMPTPIRLFIYLLPARYFVSSLQTLFLVGNAWSSILTNLLAMMTSVIILFFIISRKTVKKLD